MKKAVVIFSGGQDSTTCLGWALNRYDEVHAITFFYGQRHSIEITQAKEICKKHNVKQIFVNLEFMQDVVDSALTHNREVNAINEKGLPDTFVPNRNQLFITIAHAYAQKIGCDRVITGVCQTDESGYPDCTEAFLKLISSATNIGSKSEIKIVAPLLYFNKAKIFAFAAKEKIISDVLELSHTCYNGDHKTRHVWGYGCDNCKACELRKEGYTDFVNYNFLFNE